MCKRLYRVRKAASRGKEITLPSDIPMKPGDQVVQYYDDFVLIVPVTAVVDEFLLRRAVKVKTISRETP